SSLSIRRTLAPIGIPRSTFYDWYSRYQEGGIEALVDGKPRPRRIWNKIPDKIETAIVNLALEEPDLSPRELAVNFTDTKASFVSSSLALYAQPPCTLTSPGPCSAAASLTIKNAAAAAKNKITAHFAVLNVTFPGLLLVLEVHTCLLGGERDCLHSRKSLTMAPVV